METRTHAGVTLPVMCIGTWSFGCKDGEYWGAQDQSKTNEMVGMATATQGVGFFDTAEAYQAGRSEQSLGDALKAQGVKRTDVVLMSKILPEHCTEELVEEKVKASLERLQVEQLDLLLVHWPFLKPSGAAPGKPLPSAKDGFAALKKVQDAGLVKHLGVSNFGVKQMEEAQGFGVKIAFNELNYALLTRGIEFDVVDYCKQHDIGIIAYSPLMQGFLSGKYDSIDAIPDNRARTRHFAPTRHNSVHGGPGCEAQLFAALQKVKAIAAREGVSCADLSLAWVLANPAVTSVIAGCRDVAQLNSNAKGLSMKLTPEVVAELNEVTNEVKAIMGPTIDYYKSDADCRSF
eukprot:TRINITY_DN14814_c0_g1_i1.p1 TRINITY_DN14814_c0_g1~~TRINITY_DN14814_c0_g1_i1.p1  ORF type:complete len:347 (+),score=166.65 TRINITY_DN14814_c0_g1_i1:57-1097(+)